MIGRLTGLFLKFCGWRSAPSTMPPPVVATQAAPTTKLRGNSAVEYMLEVAIADATDEALVRVISMALAQRARGRREWATHMADLIGRAVHQIERLQRE